MANNDVGSKWAAKIFGNRTHYLKIVQHIGEPKNYMLLRIYSC